MPKSPPCKHIIIIDGTQSRLAEGQETNAGKLYKLLQEFDASDKQNIWYDPGIQGHGFWNWVTIASGWGINQTIEKAYGFLARGYKPGDEIYLFGFSRGGYAVRSLSGLMGNSGLLTSENADEARIAQAFRLYETRADEQTCAEFRNANCHAHTPIKMIGVWDTVKALGLPYPILTRLAPMATEFHSENVDGCVKAAYQALALNETRTAYSPVKFQAPKDWDGHLEQVWFRGAHSDVGGHVWSVPKARPLANIPLVWMFERIEKSGITLPQGWRDRFPCNVNVPSVGTKRGISKFFLFRARRRVGGTPSEKMHHTLLEAKPQVPITLPIQFGNLSH